MAEVTQEMILDYLVKKGGVVRNVDLVRHFKKYLQMESAQEKDRARVLFKERVNKVAFIRADSKQEKYLYLRSEFAPPGGLTRPPTGRNLPGGDHTSIVSPTSILSPTEEGGARQTDRFSFTSDLKSPVLESGLSSSSLVSPPPTSHQKTTPLAATPTSSDSSMSSKLKGLGEDDFGLSLMAELNSFGSLLDSFGVSGKTGLITSTAAKPAMPASSSSALTNAGTSSHTKLAAGTASSTSTFGPAHDHTPPPPPTQQHNSYSNSSLLHTMPPQPPQPKTSAYPLPLKTSPNLSDSTPRSSVSPQRSGSSTPQKASSISPHNSATSTPQKKKSGGRGQSDMDFDSMLSSLPSAKTALSKPVSSKKAASADSMDLTDVLSSLPSAKTSAKSAPGRGGGKARGGTATSNGPSGKALHQNTSSSSTSASNSRFDLPKPITNSSSSSSGSMPPAQSFTNSSSSSVSMPPAQSFTNSSSSSVSVPPAQAAQSFTNSSSSSISVPPAQAAQSFTNSSSSSRFEQQHQSRFEPHRFDQPKPSQPPSFQNSTRFDQPKAIQPAYQNSTRFDQPKASQPPSQPSYQNSTRFDQPKAAQPSYQNSTRFDQPKASQPPSQQLSYQNSTRFDQPKASQQPSYQNSTRFDQPKAGQPSYQNSTRFDQPRQNQPSQPAYQNSTRFDQPKASQPSFQNSTRFDQPRATQPTSNSYQNTTRFEQPKAGQTNLTAYQNNSRYDQPKAVQPSFQNSTRFEQPRQPSQLLYQQQSPTPPSGGQQAAGGQRPPPAPTHASSVHQDSHASHRPAPPPPTQMQTTHPSAPSPPVFSPEQVSSPSSGPPSLGGLDLGDFSSSFFSTTSTATSAASSSGPAPSSTLPASSAPPPAEDVGDFSAPLDTAQPANSAPNPTQPRKLGPPVALPPTGRPPRGQIDRRQNSGDSLSRRQGSNDSTPGTPTIRIDGPGNNGSPNHSRRGKSPPHAEPQPRGRTGSSSVQLRSKEGKPVRAANSAARRSKNFDKNANLEGITRLSISMTPPSSRKLRPPDVAPKPTRSASPSSSHEDGHQGSAVDAEEDMHSEYDYDEIDPLEKEWMLAAAQADIDGLQRLMMTDPTLLNRRGFLHGYTALHWAAKHGRMDILSMLLLQGAIADIKSTGGLTPLHLAAQAGHDNILEVLITQHNADISLRENGGRRPIDMLNNRVSERVKGLLSHLHNHGLPVKVESSVLPATFSRSRDSRSSLDRNWKSLGELAHHQAVLLADKDRASKKHRLSPRSAIRKSFSFKKSNKIKENVTSSPKRQKKGTRPINDHRFDA